VELKHEFEINRPVDEVWERLLDLRNVAGALPGASVDDIESDGTHHGGLRLKLGAFVASFRGTARYTEVDASAHRVVLDARGNSAQGQASVALVGQALPGSRPGCTRVELTSRVTLSGRIANFGAALATDVARQVLDQFAANLTAAFQADGNGQGNAPRTVVQADRQPQPQAPADALDLGPILVPSWLRRPVPLPVALATAATGVLVGYLLRRRTGSYAVVLPATSGAGPA
jgi:carbon monoxide dehydrogenase subunit G